MNNVALILALLTLGAAIAFFLSFFSKEGAVKMHITAILLWVFTMEQMKWVFISYIIASLLLEEFMKQEKRTTAWVLFYCGTLIFFCRLIAIALKGTGDVSTLGRDVFFGYVSCILWPLLLIRTVRKIEELYSIIITYTYLRVLECGIMGIFGYYYPDLFINIRLAYRVLPLAAEQDLVSLLQQERLVGFTILNPVDVAFHLVICISLLVCCFTAKRATLLGLVVVVAALTAIIHTWARTGFVGAALVLFAYAFLSRGPGLWGIATVVAAVAVVGYFASEVVTTRFAADERMLSLGNVYTRLEMMTIWMRQIPEAGLFGLPMEVTELGYSVDEKSAISSENIFIQMIMNIGVLGFLAYIVISWHAVISLLQVVRTKLHAGLPMLRAMSTGILITYGISMVLANTFYVSYREPIIWLLFGCMYVLIGLGRSTPSLTGAGRPPGMIKGRHEAIAAQGLLGNRPVL